MDSLVWLVLTVIQIYIWIVFAMVVVSWLLAFNVINPLQTSSSTPFPISSTAPPNPCSRASEAISPNLGGIDLSPLVLLLGLYFFRRLIVEMIYG